MRKSLEKSVEFLSVERINRAFRTLIFRHMSYVGGTNFINERRKKRKKEKEKEREGKREEKREREF